MSAEVIAAIISAGGVLISSVTSLVVAKRTTNKEIKTMRLTWTREDKLSADNAFDEMVSSVAAMTVGDKARTPTEPFKLVAALRAKETGSMGELLDKLYSAMSTNSIDQINDALTDVICEHRYQISKNNCSEVYDNE